MIKVVVALTLAGAGFFLPRALGGTALVYGTLVVTAIFATMAYGLDIILSDLGEISLAHTAFFAAGAYAAALLAVDHGFGAWQTLGGAIVVALALALVLGLITLRTREFAFSLVTYAASVVCANIVANWDALGGSDGVVGIPPLDLSVGPVRLEAANNFQLWPYAYGLLLLAIYFVHRFRRSRLGQAALMAHMNPRLAVMSGLNPHRIRLMVFLLSAPVSAVAGWLYAYQRAYVGPDLFQTYFLVLMLTAVILVGRRILIAPVIGTAILLAQTSFLSLGAYGDKLVLGVVLVAALCLFPAGLASVRWRPARTTAEPVPT
jgi:branched-chain amino acid transport system permease protein